MSLLPRVHKQETLVLINRDVTEIIVKMMGFCAGKALISESDMNHLDSFLSDAYAGLNYNFVDEKKSIEQYKALRRDPQGIVLQQT